MFVFIIYVVYYFKLALFKQGSNLIPINFLPMSQNTPEQFEILYFKVRSCQNKTSVLSDFIHKSNTDLIFITETCWL